MPGLANAKELMNAQIRFKDAHVITLICPFFRALENGILTHCSLQVGHNGDHVFSIPTINSASNLSLTWSFSFPI